MEKVKIVLEKVKIAFPNSLGQGHNSFSKQRGSLHFGSLEPIFSMACRQKLGEFWAWAELPMMRLRLLSVHVKGCVASIAEFGKG